MEKVKKLLIYLLLFIFGMAIVKHLVINPIITILFIGLIIFVAYKLEIPKFGLWLFLSALILRIIIVIVIDTPVVSDYLAQFDIANRIVNGEVFAASTSDYMLRWGYQMGYTLLMTLLLFISKGPLLIKIVNCLFTSLIVLLIYLIAKEITNKRVARIVSCLYMFFPFPLLFNTVLSNQHISSFLFLLAIYIFISKKTEKMNYKLKYFLIGLCLAIGNIIRPEAIIFITAILLYMIYVTKKINFRSTIKKFLILILTYLCITVSASSIVSYTGVSPSGFGNKEPLWKFTVGFNPETMGDYNMELAGHFIGEDRDKQLETLYDYTIGSIDKLPSLFLYKEQHFWLDSDLRWSLDYLTDNTLSIFGFKVEKKSNRRMFDSLNQIYVYLFFILALIAVYINRKKCPTYNFYLPLYCLFIVAYIF